MHLDYPVNGFDLYLNFAFVCLSNFILSVYVFCKSKGIRLKCSNLFYISITGMLITLLFVFVRMNSIPVSHLLRFLMIPIILIYLSKEKGDYFEKFIIGLVSLSLVTVLEAVANILQGTFLWAFKLSPKGFLAYFPTEVFTLLFCVIVMNIKRFKRGFQFFQQEKNLGMGLALSAIVMMLKCMDLRDNMENIYLFFVFGVGIILAGFGLYLWIRRSITAHYRERLQLKSEEHYKELLEERDEEIKKLNQSNEYLAKIVHRDNHLMSALDASVDAFFISEDENRKDELLRELQTLANERCKLIAKEQLESKLLPTTGNLLIDGAISDLYIKAAAHGIDFNLTVLSTVNEIIGKYISQTDLHTLFCDHIKDAIIAVDSRGEAGGKILVNLSMQNDDYAIDIYDNGVVFDVDTLSKLGLERVTTHADTGGSGIGFMTTFETLRKAYASLIITEFENKTPFSKSVAFRFDGENAFIIHSYRSEVLKKVIGRNDTIIQ